jgi:hypothetical protein
MQPISYLFIHAIYTCFIRGSAYEASESNFFANMMYIRPRFFSVGGEILFRISSKQFKKYSVILPEREHKCPGCISIFPF